MSATRAGEETTPPQVGNTSVEPISQIDACRWSRAALGPQTERLERSHKFCGISIVRNLLWPSPLAGLLPAGASHIRETAHRAVATGLQLSSRRRRVCSAAAAALAARNFDYRPRRLSRSPRRLVWPPTWLSSPPQVERDVPVKDSVFSSAS
jgi:hypothetical protein